MAWTNITNAAVAAGAALTTSLMTALRDNIIQAQGALKPLAEVTISSDATVTFTQFDNSIYRGYRFIIEGIEIGTSNVDFEMLMSTDGGSTFQTSYDGNALISSGTSATALRTSGTELNLYDSAQIFSATQYPISGQIDVIGAADASTRTLVSSKLTANGASTLALQSKSQWTNGFSTTVSDTDAVRFQLSSGNMVSGTIKMYGILDTLETA